MKFALKRYKRRTEVVQIFINQLKPSNDQKEALRSNSYFTD